MVVGPDRPLVASVAYDLPVTGDRVGARGATGTRSPAPSRTPLRPMRAAGHRPGPQPRRTRRPCTGVNRGRPPARPRPDLDHRRRAVPVRRHHPLRDPLPGGGRGHGRRRADRSRGTRPAGPFVGCAGLVGVRVVLVAARLDDGTRVHGADIRIPGLPVAFGYVQPPDGRCDPVDGAGGHRGRGRRGPARRRPGPGSSRAPRPGHRAAGLRTARCSPPPTAGSAGSPGPWPVSRPTDGRTGTGLDRVEPTRSRRRRGLAFVAVRLALIRLDRPGRLPVRPPPPHPVRRDGRHGHHPPRRLPALSRGGAGRPAARRRPSLRARCGGRRDRLRRARGLRPVPPATPLRRGGRPST